MDLNTLDEELRLVAEIAVARELELREYAKLNAAKPGAKGLLQLIFRVDLTGEHYRLLETLPLLVLGDTENQITDQTTGFQILSFLGPYGLLEQLRRVFVIRCLATGDARERLRTPEFQATIRSFWNADVFEAKLLELLSQLDDVSLRVHRP